MSLSQHHKQMAAWALLWWGQIDEYQAPVCRRFSSCCKSGHKQPVGSANWTRASQPHHPANCPWAQGPRGNETKGKPYAEWNHEEEPRLPSMGCSESVVEIQVLFSTGELGPEAELIASKLYLSSQPSISWLWQKDNDTSWNIATKSSLVHCNPGKTEGKSELSNDRVSPGENAHKY